MTIPSREPMRVSIKYEPRDLWVGVFWDRREWNDLKEVVRGRSLHIYVCLIPCFPIIFVLDRTRYPAWLYEDGEDGG